MSNLNAYELEGRLNGLNSVLAAIVSHLLRSDDGGLRREIEALVSIQDQQEDPGSLPEAMFAVEAAAMREVEILLGKSLSRTRANRRPGAGVIHQSEENAMSRCDQCGNDYDKTFEVVHAGKSYTFDSFECAIHKLAPECPQCGCRIVGHGVEQDEVIYCCVHCAEQKGATNLRDRAP